MFLPACLCFPFHIQLKAISAVPLYTVSLLTFWATLPPNPSFQGLQCQRSPLHFNSLTLITLLCCSKELSCIKHLLTKTLPLVSQQTINVSLNPLILCLPSVCHIQTIPYSLLSAGPILRVRLTQLTEELIFVILLRYHLLLHDPSSCLTP